MNYLLILILVKCAFASNCHRDNMSSMKCTGRESNFTFRTETYNANIQCLSGRICVEDMPVISDYTHQTLESFKITTCQLCDESIQKYVEALNATGAKLLMLERQPNVTNKNLLNITSKILSIRNSNVSSDAFNGLSVIKIDMFRNRLMLNNESFKGSSDLEVLRMDSCNLSDLPLGLFKNTPNIKSLTLINNNLTQLSSLHFDGLLSLEILDLSSNKFTSMPHLLWQGLPSLVTIKFFQNPLINIDSTIFRDTKLTKVMLSHNNNNLTFSSLALADMTHLRELKLLKCGIRIVPKDLLNNTNDVTFIDLSGNYLQNLPDEIFHGKIKLEILLLKDNRLKTLSDNLLKWLPSLQHLELENNIITEISGSTFTLNNLNKLMLGNNKLRSLDTMILPQLKELFLFGNRFQRVGPQWNTSFPKLETLDLSNNAFVELTEEDIAALPMGATVTLSNNNISTIHLSYNVVPPKLRLDKVPLRCDCLMHPYAKHLNNAASTAMCKNTLLTDVPLSDFVCDFQCPKDCSCLIRPETKLVEINCIDPLSDVQYKEIEDFRKKTYKLFSDLDTSVTLKTIPTEKTPSHVTRLNLTHLKMQKLPPLSDHLQYIDLSHNELTDPPLELFKKEGLRIWFRNNSVPCDCAHMNIWETIKSHNVTFVDRDEIFCGDKQLARLDVARICDAQNNFVIALIFGMLATLCLMIAFLLYRHRTNMKLIIYETFKWKSLREYDAFVFFAHCDLEFIKWHLLPILEEEERLRIGLNQREFSPGDWLPKSIETVVKNSRRVVLVLSKNALESEYEMRVLELALQLAVNRGAVVLKLDEVDETKLPKSLRKKMQQAYQLQFKDPAFWQKLIALLRGPKLMCVSK